MLALIFILLMDHYDGWLYFMMGVYIFYDGSIYHVWWMVSFILLYLYHGSEEDDVFIFLHMYILFSLSYPVTCTVDD